MKFSRNYFIAVLVLWPAPALWADNATNAPVKDSIYVNIGDTAPLNPASFSMKQTFGYNGGIGFGFGLSNLFQLVIDANADSFPSNVINASGGNLRVGTLLANIRFRFLAQENPLVPYLIGGMGGANVSESSIDYNGLVFPAISSTTFAARLGVGIDIRLSQMTALFVESSLYGIAGTNGAPSFNYNSLRLGGKFNL